MKSLVATILEGTVVGRFFYVSLINKGLSMMAVDQEVTFVQRSPLLEVPLYRNSLI